MFRTAFTVVLPLMSFAHLGPHGSGATGGSPWLGFVVVIGGGGGHRSRSEEYCESDLV